MLCTLLMLARLPSMILAEIGKRETVVEDMGGSRICETGEYLGLDSTTYPAWKWPQTKHL